MSRTNVVLYADDPNGIALPIQGTGRTARENRLPVDVGQTGFFEGREFRTFRRLNIPTASEILIRVTVPVNVILFRLHVGLIQGQVEMITEQGGTTAGTWNLGPPTFPRNTMSEIPAPVPSAQVVLEEGGSVSGSTEIDVVAVKTGDTSAFSGSVSGVQGSERGVAAGTYYIRVVNTDGTDAIGVIHADWEERP